MLCGCHQRATNILLGERFFQIGEGHIAIACNSGGHSHQAACRKF
jgi:hypothetical protein